MDRPSRCMATDPQTTIKGLLHPTSTLQQPRHTAHPPLKRVLGPRAGG